MEDMCMNGKEDGGMVKMPGAEVVKVDGFIYLGSTVLSSMEER